MKDGNNKLIISISILAILISLYAVFYYPFQRENPVVRLREELSDLRSRGLPIESVYSDDEIGCLVVEFGDMEPEYVETIQGIVGYDVPILFRELETKSVLSGKPLMEGTNPDSTYLLKDPWRRPAQGMR